MALHATTPQVDPRISDTHSPAPEPEISPVNPASTPTDTEKQSGAMGILTSIGEVFYEWSISSDALRWSANARQVLGIAALDAIDTGAKFGALLGTDAQTSPKDIVANALISDRGSGVAYQIEYEIAPADADGDRKLWIEDTGRWFGGADGKPEKAHGVLRVIDTGGGDPNQAYLRRFDALTGEMNRPRLVELLDEALKNSQRMRTECALILIAFDNLTAINEAYGFDVADRIIAKISNRIKSRLRGGDFLGRFSGNKFGVVLMNCSREDIETAADRFLACVTDEVISTEQGPVAASISMGGVCLPGAVKSAHDAIALAQEALDAARLRGRESFVCYEPSRIRMTERKNNLTTAADILKGLNEERVRVAFQPILAADSEAVAFREGLMRLELADGAIVEAGALMPLAEKLGLVRLIDQRLLGLVLDELAASPDAILSVNLSTQSVIKSDWFETLSAALRRLPDGIASRLVVEFNEAVLVEDPQGVSEFVSRMHGLGAKVAIDDFGAGRTSLRDLRSLKADYVKIDGTLVENLGSCEASQDFVRALVDLAKAFDTETIAKWVSDATSAAMLKEMGVDYLQGNFLAGADLSTKPETESTAAATEPS